MNIVIILTHWAIEYIIGTWCGFIISRFFSSREKSTLSTYMCGIGVRTIHKSFLKEFCHTMCRHSITFHLFSYQSLPLCFVLTGVVILYLQNIYLSTNWINTGYIFLGYSIIANGDRIYLKLSLEFIRFLKSISVYSLNLTHTLINRI